jgi:hypothetical protein
MRGGSLEEAEASSQPPQQRLLALLVRADGALADGIKLASGLPTMDRAAWLEINESAEKVGMRLERFGAVLDGLKPGARRKGRKE